MGNLINLTIWGADNDIGSGTPYVSQINGLTNAASLTLQCYDVRAIINHDATVKDYIDNKRKVSNTAFEGYYLKTNPKNNSYIGDTKTFAQAFPEKAIVMQNYNFVYSEDVSIGFETNMAIPVNVKEYKINDFDELYSVELELEKREV